MVVLFAGALVFQFRARRYIPMLYWIVVVFVSAVWTLLTYYLTDKRGVPPQVTTIFRFAFKLNAVLAFWLA